VDLINNIGEEQTNKQASEKYTNEKQSKQERILANKQASNLQTFERQTVAPTRERATRK